METSDNLWMEQIHSDTSNSAYKFYYLKSMTYVEGIQELVQRYRLFNKEKYNNLYNELGGHTRFYEYIWMKGNYTDAINNFISWHH